MNKELTEKLWKSFPLLYTGRSKPITESLISFGFECDNGWYDLLYEASEKIEPIIEKIKQENSQLSCYNCSCEFYDHRLMPSKERVCTGIYVLPFGIGLGSSSCVVPQWRRDLYDAWTKKQAWLKNLKPNRFQRIKRAVFRLFKQDWKYTKYRNLNRGIYKRINQIFRMLYRIGINYKKHCGCIKYEPFYPRAIQVKEKFGTLSFYMAGGTNEIDEIIRIAEKKSGITCEACGKKGKTRGKHWLRTMCKDCYENYENQRNGL